MRACQVCEREHGYPVLPTMCERVGETFPAENHCTATFPKNPMAVSCLRSVGHEGHHCGLTTDELGFFTMFEWPPAGPTFDVGDRVHVVDHLHRADSLEHLVGVVSEVHDYSEFPETIELLGGPHLYGVHVGGLDLICVADELRPAEVR